MSIKIKPTEQLNGDIIAPPSKSYSHRAFIASSLADGVSVIKNALIEGDVAVTIENLKKLGVIISKVSTNNYLIKGLGGVFKQYKEVIDCKNSGTSIRIFTALALLIKGGLRFKGTFIDRKRPILPLLDALSNLGGSYKLNTNSLLIKRNKKKCRDLEIRGDISSQFITALLMVGPLIPCKKTSHITLHISSPLTSYPYILITLDVLKHYGINIQEYLNNERLGKYIIPCHQNYRARNFTIPGDFSSISYLIAAGVLTSSDSTITISNLDFTNPQGDKRLIDILREMGAQIEINSDKGNLLIKGNRKKYPLKGYDINIQDIPDLFPILAVIGVFASGKTSLYNALSLRYKESDRILTMARELRKMGVKVEQNEDKLTIYHCSELKGIEVTHDNDHRIAMALTIANLFATTNSKIENIDIVKDSYPSFVEDLIKLGALIELD
jgi:3-phosphoshikimate 1-carboxyvinyltransferase